MAIFDRRAASVVTTVLLFAIALAILAIAWKTAVVLLFALLFAYLMEPIVRWFEKRFKKRWQAIAITYLLFWMFVAGFGYVGGQKLTQQAKAAATTLPATFNKIKSGDIAYELGRSRGWSQETQQRLHDLLAKNAPALEGAAQRFAVGLPSIIGALGWGLLVPFLAMLFPRDKAGLPLCIVDRFTTAQSRQRRILQRAVKDADVVLADYMWAQFLLSVIAFVVFWPALALMKVPGALLLALFASVAEFIFIVGPLAAAIAILGTVFVSGEGNWLVVLGFLIVWRLVQDYVNTPLLLSAELKMPALAIIASVLIGGEIGGGLGMFVAVPVAAVIRLLWRRWDMYKSGESKAFELPAKEAA